MRHWLALIETMSAYPVLVDADFVQRYVRGLHSRPEDFADGDLAHRIWRFRRYTLESMPLAALDADQFGTDDALVADYAAQTSPAPPIVYDPLDASIIDGTHRARALRARGAEHIWAYIGYDPDPDWSADEADDAAEDDDTDND